METSVVSEPKPAMAVEGRDLVERHKTTMQVVNNLLVGGVREEHLDEVLDLKAELTTQKREFDKKTGEPKIIVDTVSSEVLAKAYMATEGDLDDLSVLVNHANEAASDIKHFHGAYSLALKATTDLYQDGGLSKVFEN